MKLTTTIRPDEPLAAQLAALADEWADRLFGPADEHDDITVPGADTEDGDA